METARTIRASALAAWLCLAASLGACAEPPACPASAQAFWSWFRSSALSRKTAAMADAARFPFVVRGQLDSSGQRELTREQFVALVPALLAADPGTSATPTTMEALVASTKTLPAPACSGEGRQFRVGVWSFALTSAGWRFQTAYLDE
jgi:hypothetical protein